MNRTDIVQHDSAWINQALAESNLADRWRSLTQVLGHEAPRLLKLVCSVLPPNRISSLAGLEAEQAVRGAGFHGMLPDQIPEDIKVPIDLDSSLGLALQLAQIRSANHAAITETMPDYAIAFTGREFDLEPTGAVPSGWKLSIDASGIHAALDLFASDTVDKASVIGITQMPAFNEMMRHRRELGYVPEPLIDAEGLAWCLMHAASRDPIDELWKWLNPQNLFDLSDLCTHRIQYMDLTHQLIDDGRLSTYILGRIAPYAPLGVAFEDRISFAVGWGIRGWATEQTGGVNIEHFKDKFQELLATLVHETFHRLQTEIALADPTVDKPGFDRITSYPFDSSGDSRLYQALCYVMLEGSATYVAGQGNSEIWREEAAACHEILREVCSIEGHQEENGKFEELLNAGLRSNGPFYGCGALLSRAIVKHGGQPKLGAALRDGAPSFFERGLEFIDDELPCPFTEITPYIRRLRAEIVHGVSR